MSTDAGCFANFAGLPEAFEADVDLPDPADPERTEWDPDGTP
jgi:hypothetical protein